MGNLGYVTYEQKRHILVCAPHSLIYPVSVVAIVNCSKILARFATEQAG